MFAKCVCLCCSQVTAYGGELSYKVRYEPRTRTQVIDGKPDVVLQGNGIFLEHFSQSKPLPRVPTSVTVTFREVGVSSSALSLPLPQ